MIFVYMVENITYAKKPKAVVENTQNNAFMMNVFFEKNDVSVWLKSTMLGVKKSIFKNLVLNVKKCHLNAIHKVSFLLYKIYIYQIYLDYCV